jgi:hypothetical protein
VTPVHEDDRVGVEQDHVRARRRRRGIPPTRSFIGRPGPCHSQVQPRRSRWSVSWKLSFRRLALVRARVRPGTMRNVCLPRSTATSPPRSTSSRASERRARSWEAV